MEPVSEWRASVGGEIETDSHGIFDLGWRRGPTSVQLLTDTLDARTSHDWPHGRITVGARAAAAAAGLWITPWSHGAPDPRRAQLAGYAGPDLRVERWGPHGTYGAVEVFAHGCWFEPVGASTLDLPATAWGHAALVAGYWDPSGRAVRLTGGVDATGSRDGSRVAPLAQLEATLDPTWKVAPIGELRAGWASNQDDVLATRLGGLTPYEVPLAGAAWAEFWVQDYVASRVGARVTAGDLAPYAVFDAAAWTYPDDTTLPSAPERQSGWGAGLGLRWTPKPVTIDVTAGWAPDLPRADGVHDWSLYVLAGTGWLGKHR